MAVCYGYVRVSTEYQANDGLSLETQEKKIKEYTKEHELNLVEIYTDKGKSGTKIEGREVKEPLKIMKKGDILITYDVSRLTRNVKDCDKILVELEEKGCLFVSIKENFDTKTPEGKAKIAEKAADAEAESNVTSERVKEGMLMKKEKGEFLGRISYGWKLSNGKGSDLIEVPEEQEIIRKIKEMKREREKVKDIIKYLEDNKISPPKTSSKWHPSTIYGIINRGEVVVKGREKREKDS